MAMKWRQELESIRLTPSLTVFVFSLLLGVPFAIGWVSDAEHFPNTLQWLVTAAAALHVGSVGGRIVAVKVGGFPISGLIRQILIGYLLWAIIGIAHWQAEEHGIKLAPLILLDLPAAYGLYLIARAMTVDPTSESGRPAT